LAHVEFTMTSLPPVSYTATAATPVHASTARQKRAPVEVLPRESVPRDAGPAAPATRRNSAREKLLSSAATLFYAQGINAVGIDTIIANAGVAKMSLYNNFANKNDLIAEVLKREDALWFARFTTFIESRPAGSARILAVFDFLAQEFDSPAYRGCLFQLACAELPDAAHPGRRVVLSHKHRFRLTLQRLCRETQIEHADRVADQLILLTDGAIAWRAMTGSPEPIRRAREVAESLVGTG
jgi:AcrR family transcriptional regulator